MKPSVRGLSWPALVGCWFGALLVALFAFVPAMSDAREHADELVRLESEVRDARTAHAADLATARRSAAHADTIFELFTSPRVWRPGRPAPPIIDYVLQQARGDSLTALESGLRLRALESEMAEPHRTPLKLLMLGPATLLVALAFAAVTYAVKKQSE